MKTFSWLRTNEGRPVFAGLDILRLNAGRWRGGLWGSWKSSTWTRRHGRNMYRSDLRGLQRERRALIGRTGGWWKRYQSFFCFTFQVPQRHLQTAARPSLWSTWCGCGRDRCSPARGGTCTAAWWSRHGASPLYPGPSARSPPRCRPLPREGEGVSASHWLIRWFVQ